MLPENSNIQHLISVRDSIPQFTIANTDVYYLSNALFQDLKDIDFDKINDIESYAIIVDWLYNMDSTLNLAPGIDLSCLWRHAESCSLKAVSSMMYSAFCGNKDAYDAYLKDNRPAILAYLKRKTKSHTIKVDDGCIKVEYILRASEKKRGNEASVSRLKDICRMLPVFEKYCSDAISPHINLLDGYIIPDDAHKEMPRRNLVITFHQEFNSLSDVLSKVIDNGGVIGGKPKLQDFTISPDQLARVRISQEPVRVTQLVDTISEAVDNPQMKKLSTTTVTNWLLEKGFLEKQMGLDGKSRRVPTHNGLMLGLSTETRQGQYGEYQAVFYTAAAQQFVLDNLPDILAKKETAQN